MRRLITGVDSDGQSCVTHQADVSFVEGVVSGVRFDTAFETLQCPPPVRPLGRGDLLDLGVEPGLARWALIEWEAGLEVPNHHTDTLDFDVVLGGTVELILDDGAHALSVGDCVVVTGVDHSWRVGPDGCRMSVVVIGTPPRP
jgi:quercetin dioxygenase-like cupin family protein